MCLQQVKQTLWVRLVWRGIGTTGRPDLNCCRVIFGEADFLPGITVDKYADVLVVECLALGMEQFKGENR